jgi:ABC-type phosphonate transport system ATPase subunit
VVAVFVGTTPFLPLARYETARRGVIDPRMVIVDHPLGGVPADDIAQRADDARKVVADLINDAR